MEQDFIEVIKQSFVDSGKRSLISTLRTNNLFIDTIVSTILLTALTYLLNPNFFASFQIGWIHFDTIKSLFFRKYSISFEGKQCYIVSHYDQCPIIASCFSDNFNGCLLVWGSVVRRLFDLFHVEHQFVDVPWDGASKTIWIVELTTARS
jgi:hypothetical protein